MFLDVSRGQRHSEATAQDAQATIDGYIVQTWSTNRGASMQVYRSVKGSDIDEIPRQPRGRLCLVHQDKFSEMREEGQANPPQHPRKETIALIVRSMSERAQITWNELCKI